MKKCVWHEIPAPTETEDLVQVYEFTRVPANSESLTEIRVFFDIGQEELLRSRKFANGRIDWFKTSPHYDVVEDESNR